MLQVKKIDFKNYIMFNGQQKVQIKNIYSQNKSDIKSVGTSEAEIAQGLVSMGSHWYLSFGNG